MKRFAALYAALDDTRGISDKVALMQLYFADAPAEDAAWGLYFLLGNRLKRLIAPTRLRGLIIELSGLPPAVIEESYAHVGDLGEMLALVLDTVHPRRPEAPDADLSLSRSVHQLLALRDVDETAQRRYVLQRWRELPYLPCLLFNKLLTGSLRVGVSAGLAARALAATAGLDTRVVQARLMGDWNPSAEAFVRLMLTGETARDPSQPYPFCLASPLEAPAETLGPRENFLAEWKWDGIRGQLIRRDQRTWLWSRGEELLDGRFPEIETAAAALPDGTVLDGEVLAWNAVGVMPFAALQKRIGRKTVGKKLLADAPVVFLAYDLLEHGREDLRTRPLHERRSRLQELLACLPESERKVLRLSGAVDADGWSALATLREHARDGGTEGLMLKRLDSPYLGGRKRGTWWKWKVGALTVDTVLVYAQAGHGRRSNLYTDYTLAVWDGDALVPVAKAYSGLTDAELTEMDRWIRAHTLEKFGPVRSVQALQVFEIAFEGIQASPRHKSGVALRFPRIARWRRDKLARDADRIETLRRLTH
ncbi:MAG: ATP-dependent DNA ligase [Panacagrimonas sp.]